MSRRRYYEKPALLDIVGGMMILLILGVGVVLELLVYFVKPVWHIYKVWAGVALLLTAFATGAAIFWQFNLFSVLFGLVGLYRLFNMLRLVESRMHDRYLRTVTRRTGLQLLILQSVIAGLGFAWLEWHVTGHGVWTILAALQVAGGVVLLSSVSRNLKHTKWPQESQQAYSDHDLPTVTVAIPARNETEDLQQCLQSVIASDYPKLEILVLDDCSQNKRTPEIIRQFAHDGVRFIQGEPPHETWLPKNQAYARLADEASGQYILFCGVDVRFEPGSLRQLVTTMLSKNKQMMSILPRRQHSAYGQLSLIQAMRYWWELVPPRRLFRRPPVLSSCWIIKHSALKEAGGFAAVRRMIIPEAHFAKQLIATESYSFMRASTFLGITSGKQVGEQRDTALRMRYPQLHKRPEQVALLTILELVFFLLPFVIVVAGYWISVGWLAHALAAAACVLLVLAYMRTVLATHVNTWWFAIIGLPLGVLTDIFILHYSMSRYEFSSVDWKGRNVCIPVMHVVPRLPKIE